MKLLDYMTHMGKIEDFCYYVYENTLTASDFLDTKFSGESLWSFSTKKLNNITIVNKDYDLSKIVGSDVTSTMLKQYTSSLIYKLKGTVFSSDMEISSFTVTYNSITIKFVGDDPEDFLSGEHLTLDMLYNLLNLKDECARKGNPFRFKHSANYSSFNSADTLLEELNDCGFKLLTSKKYWWKDDDIGDHMVDVPFKKGRSIKGTYMLWYKGGVFIPMVLHDDINMGEFQGSCFIDLESSTKRLNSFIDNFNSTRDSELRINLKCGFTSVLEKAYDLSDVGWNAFLSEKALAHFIVCSGSAFIRELIAKTSKSLIQRNGLITGSIDSDVDLYLRYYEAIYLLYPLFQSGEKLIPYMSIFKDKLKTYHNNIVRKYGINDIKIIKQAEHIVQSAYKRGNLV